MTSVYLELAAPAVGAIACAVLIVWLGGVVRYIPNDRLGILEKKWSWRGSIPDGLIALEGEAGF